MIALNKIKHSIINLNKTKQDLFYSDPVGNTERAWLYIQQNQIKPISYRGRDIYVIPHSSSGYATGLGGQMQNLDNLTIITETNSNRLITAFPSGRTPPLPIDYEFTFGARNEFKPRKF